MTLLFLLFLLTLPLAAQTGINDGSTSKLVNDGTAAHTGHPVTLCVRAKRDSTTGNRALVAITDQSSDHMFFMNSDGDSLECFHRGATSSQNITLTSIFPVDTWSGGCCVYENSSIVAVGPSTNTSGAVLVGAPTGLDYTSIGVRRFNSSDFNFYDGLIAEAATWSRALTIVQAQSYINGTRAQDVAGGGADHIWGGFWGVDYGSATAIALTNTNVTCSSDTGPGTSSVPENCSGPISTTPPATWFTTSEAIASGLLIDNCATSTQALWNTFSNGEQQFNETAAGTAVGDGCYPYRPAFQGRPGTGGSAGLYHYYVDSVNGNDSNTGGSESQALATLAEVESRGITPGTRIGLARNSHWREELDIALIDNVTIEAYGTGARPLLDASDVVPAGNWTKTAGQTNVYEVTVAGVPGVAGNALQHVWEDNAAMVRKGSIGDVDTNPNSFFVSAEFGTIIYYVHASDSSSPITNGKSYERTARVTGLRTGADNTIQGIHTRRNIDDDGSLLLGTGNTVTDCQADDGNLHNVYVGPNTTINGLNVSLAYNGVDNTGSKVMVVYNGNGPGGTFEFNNLHCLGNGDNAVCLSGHTNNSTNFASVTVTDSSAQNVDVAFAGGNADLATFTNVEVVGTVTRIGINSSHDELVVDNSPMLYGFDRAVDTVTTTDITVTNSSLDSPSIALRIGMAGAALVFQGNTSNANLHLFGTAGAGTVTATGNTFTLQDAIPSSRFYTLNPSGWGVTSDFNSFNNIAGAGTLFRVNGTDYASITDWHCGTGQDANSTPPPGACP